MKQNGPESNMGNIACKDNLSQDQCTNTVLDVDKPCTSSHFTNETRAVLVEVINETLLEEVDGFENENEPTADDPDDDSKENRSISLSECKDLDDQVNDESSESTSPAASLHKDAYSYEMLQMGDREKMNVISNPVDQGFCENSQQGTDDGKDTPSVRYDIFDASAKFDSLLDERLDEQVDNLLLDKPDEATEGNENLGEECSTFLSELHKTEDICPSDFGQSVKGGQILDDSSPCVEPEPFDIEKSPYDPSVWTPIEIETATGNADSTHVEHSLKLRSTYTEVEVNHIVFLLFLFVCSAPPR